MKDDVTFSVVIPCYNDHTKIARAVESCIHQSYPPFEIIIVDDGSKAETRDVLHSIIKKFSSVNIKPIMLDKNNGVSRARNIGMDAASAEYICFLDSDDAWHPEKLLIANQYLKNCKEKVALAHDFTYHMEDFKLLGSNGNLRVSRITFFSILFKNPITTPSLIIPSSIGIRFRSDMRFAEDHELLLRLCKRLEILFINRKLVFIDRKLGSKGGLSGERWKMRKGEMRMYLFLAKSNVFFVPALPFLICFSLIKHLWKTIINMF